MTLPALRPLWLSLSLVSALCAGIAAATAFRCPSLVGGLFSFRPLGSGLCARYRRKAFFFLLIPVFFCLGAGRLQLALTPTMPCLIRQPERISSSKGRSLKNGAPLRARKGRWGATSWMLPPMPTAMSLSISRCRQGLCDHSRRPLSETPFRSLSEPALDVL